MMHNSLERQTRRSTQPAGQSWIRPYGRQAEPRLRLFCFPYAVGGATAFAQWPQHFSADVEVLAVQLPGREDRFAEPAIERLPALIDALAPALLPLLDRPFAFFGHSLGALVSFELARCLIRDHQMVPAHLFVSARGAPQLGLRRPPIHRAPTPVLLAELRRMGGTSHVVLENPELAELVIELMRADYSLYETYSYTDGPPLPCPITAFGGLEDGDVGREGLMAWQAQSRDGFALHMLPGHHFFLNSARAALTELICQVLDTGQTGAAPRLYTGQG